MLSTVPYNPAAGNATVKRALHCVGRGNYMFTACNNTGNFDCSGFVSYALTGNYIRLGTTYTFTHNDYLFPQVMTPQPGDIVIRHSNTSEDYCHCGIYYMHNMMIECRNGRNVIIEEFDDTFHFRRYLPTLS